MGFVKKSNAAGFLFLNSVLWGSSYVWSKMLLNYLPRFTVLSICSLGALVTTVILFFRHMKGIRLRDVGLSLLVSLFSIISNSFFMLALQYTSSSNTAFIVQMSVVITPILMAVLEKKVPKGKVLAGAGIALLGLFMITCDFNNFHLNTGDLLALGNALFFSLYLVSLNRIAKDVEPVHFTLVNHSANTLAFLAMAAFMEIGSINTSKLASPVFALLVGASVLVAVMTSLFQSAAIRYVRPEKATILYTFEPVTALLLAALLIGERLEGIKSAAGCVLILAAVVLSVYKPGISERRPVPFKRKMMPVKNNEETEMKHIELKA